MIERERRPTLPGEILIEMYMQPRGITQTALADTLGCTRKHVSAVVHGHARLSPTMAAQLGEVLGTSAQLWLNLQTALDIHDARERLKTWRPTRTWGPESVQHG